MPLKLVNIAHIR